MQETVRFTGSSDVSEWGFVEREATPESAMKLGIRLYLAGLSLSDTVSVPAGLGVERCRTTVHTWIQNADLQLTEGHSPNHLAVDETVIQVNDQRYWLYAAVDPATNYLLHVRLFSTRTAALTEMFLVDDAVFLVDGAPWLQAACHYHDPRFQHVTHDRNAVERVFKGLKRRTEQFANRSDTLSPKPLKHGCKRSQSTGIG